MAGRFNVDVDVRGIAKAINEIKKFDIVTQKRVKDTVNDFALKIQKGAKSRAPVDKGRLRASIAMEPYKDGMSVRVGSRVHYAPYVEHGTGIFAEKGDGRKTPWRYKNRKGETIWTRGQKPQPYLHPSAEEQKSPYIKAMRDVLKKGR